jgi:hypothetical protein
VRTVIYGETYTRANAKLVEIVDDLRCGDVLDFKLSKNQSFCMLKNGDIIMTIAMENDGDNIRGVRWNYAYIDAYIDKKAIEEYIKPHYTDKDITIDGCITYSTLKESYEYYD